MRFAFFVHSLVSDWNHGNAHFLRGVMRELQAAGHDAVAWEPANGWSRVNLVRDHGEAPVQRFRDRFPGLVSRTYDAERLDVPAALDGVDVAIVHEWNEPRVIAALGRYRQWTGGPVLLFHDTHHRAATAPEEIDRLDLSGYDGALCFGRVIRDAYLTRGWTTRAWTWHEAADVALFRPRPELARIHELVWVGNWGDEERSRELHEFLLGPIATLRLDALVHGVRYPAEGLAAIARAGARFGGWLPNDAVPEVFAAHRVTVHVPRRPYVEALPGIPTIRVFEALACGIPLVSAPWSDCEGLFRPGRDYLVARDRRDMTDLLHAILDDPDLAEALSAGGLDTVRRRHTCAHRVAELLAIVADCRRAPALAAAT